MGLIKAAISQLPGLSQSSLTIGKVDVALDLGLGEAGLIDVLFLTIILQKQDGETWRHCEICLPILATLTWVDQWPGQRPVCLGL